MIDSFELREIINGVWFCLNIALSAVFWRYVALKSRKRDWYRDASAQGAIALAFYFSGSTLMRAWVWVLLLMERRGDDIAFLGDQYMIPLTAAAFATTGALCCIRVFSPGPWGRCFWIGTGVLSFAIPIAVHYLV